MKNLTKGEIVGVIGSAILTAFAGVLLNIATLSANKEEIHETVKRELEERNEVEP
jgi:hypothetical protein|nr:MAG TPA: hypothetical protein [Caudoviricetes sp.]